MSQDTDDTRRLHEGSRWQQALDQQAAEKTVADLIAAYESPVGGINRVWRLPDLKVVIDRLVELGLTQLDWVALPNSTVTTAMLKGLGRDALRERSILVLGTLSPKAVRSLERILRKAASIITVGELLCVSPMEWLRRGFSDFGVSIAKTREKLSELGFRYEDGVFLQEGTKRQFVESLIKEEKLRRPTATKVAEIAERREWIPKFVE